MTAGLTRLLEYCAHRLHTIKAYIFAVENSQDEKGAWLIL